MNKVMKNAISWFEIPALDLERAKKFYGDIFQAEMEDFEMGEFKMVCFPGSMSGEGVGGALLQNEFYEPRDNGVLIYLNAEPDIQAVIDRIEPAGGSVQIPRTQISPEIGYMSVFTDTEGNRIALHSMN
jgi:hypothetical protein